MEKLHIITDGEFELFKTVEYVDPQFKERKFDLKEFLPHTKHHFQNEKNKRFIQSVEAFKIKEPFDKVEKIQVGIFCPCKFVGLEECMHEERHCMYTLKC